MYNLHMLEFKVLLFAYCFSRQRTKNQPSETRTAEGLMSLWQAEGASSTSGLSAEPGSKLLLQSLA